MRGRSPDLLGEDYGTHEARGSWRERSYAWRALFRRPLDDLSFALPNHGASDRDDAFGRTSLMVARARLLLALVNIAVLAMDSSRLSGDHFAAFAEGSLASAGLLLYSVWVLWEMTTEAPPHFLPPLTAWLDAFFSAVLVWSTGAFNSPFFLWYVFTVMAASLTCGWRTALQVCLAEVLTYAVMCLPQISQTDFLQRIFLVRTLYLFVIALVLAYMGQRVLEQKQMLTGIQRSVAYLTSGRSRREVLGRLADTATELLSVERVAVGEVAEGEGDSIFVNLDPDHGERILHRAREWSAGALGSTTPGIALMGDAADQDRPCGVNETLCGLGTLLVLRLPAGQPRKGVLVVGIREGNAGFTRADRELAELLAALADPLLENVLLQEQRRYHAGVDERRRIAAELHDGLIQTLASMDLRTLACTDLCRNARWELLSEELLLLKRLAEQSLTEARGAINELAPVRLREAGLAAYLEDFLRQFRLRESLRVCAKLELGDLEVPEPTALIIIRLLREGLNNVRKHAQASRVSLRITATETEINFRLEDNGVGFRVAENEACRPPTHHYGLAYLRERVESVEGKMQVKSAPGEGVVLEAWVPQLTEERLVSLLSQRET